MERFPNPPFSAFRLVNASMKFFGPSTLVLGIWIFFRTLTGSGSGGWPFLSFQFVALLCLVIVYFGVYRLTQVASTQLDNIPHGRWLPPMIVGGATGAYLVTVVQLMNLLR